MAHILVVDDDSILRRLLRQVLEPRGHTVWDAEDGDAGLRVLRTFAVDIVLCDIVMPNKEGLETIREMRVLMPHVAIVAMSGGGIIDPLPLARRMGADQILYKPFAAQELSELVESLIGAARS